MAQRMTTLATHPDSRIARLPARLFGWLLASLLGVASVTGCSTHPPVVDGLMPVEIGGRTYQLEIVADDTSRTVGLGGRSGLAPDHGMLFSFPDARLRRFVMRDCVFPIDIIFLDSAGRIVAMHHMPIEEPKKEGESQYEYEMRLAKYSSRFNAQYAIELDGGELERLDLKDGQQIDLDTEYLRSITQ